MVVLILKGGGDYRGIDLVEMVWKAVAVILNRRFTASITYHNSLHGFRAVRGTGGNTSAGYGHEEGGPPHNLPGPEQGIRCLGQVQVTGHTEGIWHGFQGPLPHPQILV